MTTTRVGSEARRTINVPIGRPGSVAGFDPISPEAWRAYNRSTGPDVYETAILRLSEGDVIAYPARDVLGIHD